MEGRAIMLREGMRWPRQTSRNIIAQDCCAEGCDNGCDNRPSQMLLPLVIFGSKLPAFAFARGGGRYVPSVPSQRAGGYRQLKS